MTIPAFLTGSAGRAIDDVMKVRGYASATNYAFTNVAEHGMTAGAATRALDLLGDRGNHELLRATVNGAKPGLRRALGSAQPHFSASMHADLGMMRSSRSILASEPITAARAVQTANFGAKASADLIDRIDTTLPQLEAAARRTALLRLAAGSLAVGGGIAGINALRSGGGDEQIMAPGPLGPGAPDLPSTGTYA